MHKPIPFIGSNDVEGRASAFQTKRPGSTQTDDGVKSNKSNQLEQKVSSVESRQADGLQADEQQNFLLLAKAKETPHHVSGDHTGSFTLTERNKAEPRAGTLRTFKTCYGYNKDVKKKIITKIKTLGKSFPRSKVQTATAERVKMLRRKRG